MERHTRSINGEARGLHTRRVSWRRVRFQLALFTLSLLAMAGLGAGVVLWRLGRGLPNVERLMAYQPSQTTEIRSSDGVLLARVFDENRVVVPLAQIPLDLRDATIAVEDHRFFEHRGVDWRGTARALLSDLRDGRYAEGGSTITQQLVRNVFLQPDKRLSRKIREAMLAIQVERRFSKPDILAMYLNQVYYGERSFGVEAASRIYFAKSVQDLTLPEAALIAGLPQRPTYFDPYENPKAARDRRNLVLQRMVDTGYLSPKRAHAAMRAPLRLAYAHPPRITARRAPYFVDYVLSQLEDRYGAQQVYRGGLRVQTTLNTRAQAAAEQAVRYGMNRWFGRRPTEAALVSIDPTNGYIRAMVGGRDYRRSSFNRAAQARRQPGSAFKPFVYAAALNEGMSPMDRIEDAPITFTALHWSPKNYDHRWHGQVTLTTALAESINIPAIKLIDRIGPFQAASMAHTCGITSNLKEDLSLALGTSEVTPLELASAYGTFATGGMHTPPVAIESVSDSRGAVLESDLPNAQPVLDESVARSMDYMLRQVVRMGTGRPAGIVPNARGKTGTTDSLHDAWFVGYTPDLVTAVWVGNDHPSRIPGITGGGVCAPIWASYMLRALAILPKHPVPQPLPPGPKGDIHVAENADRPAPAQGTAADGTAGNDPFAGAASVRSDEVRRRICLESGQLANPSCPATEVETFTRGTEPTEHCTIHTGGSVAVAWAGQDGARSHGRAVIICADSGGLAGPNCPNVITERLAPGEAPPPPCTLHDRRQTVAHPGTADQHWSENAPADADPPIMPPEPPSGGE